MPPILTSSWRHNANVTRHAHLWIGLGSLQYVRAAHGRGRRRAGRPCNRTLKDDGQGECNATHVMQARPLAAGECAGTILLRGYSAGPRWLARSLVRDEFRNSTSRRDKAAPCVTVENGARRCGRVPILPLPKVNKKRSRSCSRQIDFPCCLLKTSGNSSRLLLLRINSERFVTTEVFLTRRRIGFQHEGRASRSQDKNQYFHRRPSFARLGARPHHYRHSTQIPLDLRPSKCDCLLSHPSYLFLPSLTGESLSGRM